MGWTHTDLSLATSAPSALTAPCAFVFEALGTQHVDFIGQDGCVYDLLEDGTGWSLKDLTTAASAPLVFSGVAVKANNPAGYAFSSQGTLHVFFVGDDPHVHELWSDGTSWFHNDLTDAIGAPLAVVVRPSAYVFEAQGTQHVDYIGEDGHIHELWWDESGWHYSDLIDATGAPLPALVPPSGYAFDAQGSQHVAYVGQEGHIHEITWVSGTWSHSDLTALSGAPSTSPQTSLASYVFVLQGTRHVDYVAIDGGSIHELTHDGSGWHHDNLSVMAGAAGANGGGVLCAYPFDSQATRHVGYTDGTGHISELWWDNNGWHYNDLTKDTSAPPADQGTPAAYVFASQRTQHIFYIGIEDSHIHELRWRSGTVVPRPVPPFPPLLS